MFSAQGNFVVLLAAMAPRALASSDVLVVAPSGTHYSTIQSAIDAAHEGDIVLVKPGSYRGVAIASKGVAVVADVGGIVHVRHGAIISNIASESDVLLHGLELSAAPGAASGLYASECQGSVRVQHCNVAATPSKSGIRIESCLDVALTNTTGIGGVGIPNNYFRNGGSGASVWNSSLALYGCELRGGDGAPTICTGGNGGDGLSLRTAFAFVGDSLLRGGDAADGGPGPGSSYSDGGNGGDGARVIYGYNGPSHFAEIADELSGGHAGAGSYAYGCMCGIEVHCYGDHGQVGIPLLSYAGNNLEAYPNLPPLLEVDTDPVREHSSVAFTFHGQPGDSVVLLMNNHTSFEPAVHEKGVFLVDRESHPIVMPIGVLGPAGTLTRHWIVPAIGVGVHGQVVHLQCLHTDKLGRSTLSNPVHLVELDAAF